MQYFNKVEISGINTSQIKVLSDKESQELLRKARAGDMKARDDLIKGNLRLVLSVVQRFANRGENFDDLFQVGVIGLRDTAYKAMQVKEKLTNKYGKEPSVEEIAKQLNMKKSDVVIALEAIVDPVSLYEPVYNDGGDTIYVMDQVGDNSTDTDWIDEIMIKDKLKNLDSREHRILYMRFMQGKTQMETAEEIGISQAQVSRLEKNALKRIKGE